MEASPTASAAISENRIPAPDFVAETTGYICMLESKARNALQNPDVLAKRAAAVAWCRHASQHAQDHGGKSWRYALIPHDTIAENMALDQLVSQFGVDA